MISKKMEAALNDQIQAELYSAYLYLAMSAYFEDQNLGGLAGWMRVQFQEEQFHALKFFHYLAERGGRVELAAIEKPAVTWDGPVDVFEKTLEHERVVTGRIHDLVEMAQAEKDHATASFLNWFVDEQVEEEATAGEILEKFRMVRDNANGILMLDRALGERTFQAGD